MGIQVTHLDARGGSSTTHQAWMNACEPGDLAITSISSANIGTITSNDGWSQVAGTNNNSGFLFQSVWVKTLTAEDASRYHTWNSTLNNRANVGTIVLRGAGGISQFAWNMVTVSNTSNTFPGLTTAHEDTYHVNLTAVRVGTSGVSMSTPAGWTTQFNQSTTFGSGFGYQNVVNTNRLVGPAQTFPTVSATMGSSVYKSNFRLAIWEVPTEFRGWGIPPTE